MSDTPFSDSQNLAEWEDEGGALYLAAADTFPLEVYDEQEKRVLAFLGASVLSLWEGLPEDFRRVALRREAAQDAYNESVIRARLSRLLRASQPANSPKK